MKVSTKILFPNDQKEDVVVKSGLSVGLYHIMVGMTHGFLRGNYMKGKD